ncbi:hypothetical protein BGX26_003719 [Mortierella sp. AD094]|nr:hypothetical protein BGX26_003719 [Mortierella sp. AD094]
MSEANFICGSSAAIALATPLSAGNEAAYCHHVCLFIFLDYALPYIAKALNFSTNASGAWFGAVIAATIYDDTNAVQTVDEVKVVQNLIIDHISIVVLMIWTKREERHSCTRTLHKNLMHCSRRKISIMFHVDHYFRAGSQSMYGVSSFHSHDPLPDTMLNVTLPGLNSNDTISGAMVNIAWTTTNTTTWSSIVIKLIQNGGNVTLQNWSMVFQVVNNVSVALPIVGANQVVHFELWCSTLASPINAALCGQSSSFNLFPETPSTAMPGLPPLTATLPTTSTITTTRNLQLPSSTGSSSNTAPDPSSSLSLMNIPIPAFIMLLVIIFTSLALFMICILRCRQARQARKEDSGEKREQQMHQQQQQSFSSKSSDIEQGPPILPPWSPDFGAKKSKSSRFFQDNSSSSNELSIASNEDLDDSTHFGDKKSKLSRLFQDNSSSSNELSIVSIEDLDDSTLAPSLEQHPHPHPHLRRTRTFTPSLPARSSLRGPARRSVSVVHLNKPHMSIISAEGEFEDVRIDPSPPPSRRVSVRRHETLPRQVGRRDFNEVPESSTWSEKRLIVPRVRPTSQRQYHESVRLSAVLDQYFDEKSSSMLDVSKYSDM